MSSLTFKEGIVFVKNNNFINFHGDYVGHIQWLKAYIDTDHEYDENNNLIHYKDSTGKEEWYRYDENNNLIYYKDSNGIESWKEYDENNNLIHYKDSTEYEYWKSYDKNNNLIYYKDSNGIEYNNEIQCYEDK